MLSKNATLNASTFVSCAVYWPPTQPGSQNRKCTCVNNSSISCRYDAVEETSTQQSGPPCPRLSSPGEWERNAVMANRVGINMLQFCSVSNSLSHTTLSIKWEVYFSNELCHSNLLCRRYDSACNASANEYTTPVKQLVKNIYALPNAILFLLKTFPTA